jgi:hypothetical protein
MSQKCPHCGLFNTPHAVRCDCGYHFATGHVQRSPVVSHLADQAGELRARQKSARSDIQGGIALLALSAVLTVAMFLLSPGRVYFSWLFTGWGAILPTRGLRVRRACSTPGALRESGRRP